MSTEHGWSDSQVRDFERRFRRSREFGAWFAFPDFVREALLTEFVVGVVTGNERSVTVIEMLSLRTAIAERLAVKP